MLKRLKKGLEKRRLSVLLTVLAAVLVFGGPTYLLYFLYRMGLPYPLSALLGLGSFAFGLFLFVRILSEGEGKA